ncbi:MAG: hypothetical protein ACOC9S_03260 [Planctomycetota bacterium]
MTTCWSFHRDGLLSVVWRPAAALYLGCCLVALAVGLWPEAIMPPEYSTTLMPPPALRTLAAGQGVFVLLIYPLVLWRRCRRGAPAGYFLRAAAESAGLLMATIPFYITAGYFADATAADVIRAVIAVALLLPVAWTAGLLSARGVLRPVVVLVLVFAAVGGPAMVYITREFLPEFAAGAGVASPVILLWQTAAPRQDALVPQPVWAAVLWPALAAAALLAQMLVPHRPGGQEGE